MSAPRDFEVSFRAELDDRQVDALADTLWDLGFDALCFRPLLDPADQAPYEPRYSGDVKICSDCGDRYLSWGAHAERCTGVRRAAKGGAAR